MLNQIVNRLRGQVCVRVEAAFPERVLNLCGARDLAFWDLTWESETAFTCRLSRRDFAALRRAAKKLDCTLTAVRREGAPFFWGGSAADMPWRRDWRCAGRCSSWGPSSSGISRWRATSA